MDAQDYYHIRLPLPVLWKEHVVGTAVRRWNNVMHYQMQANMFTGETDLICHMPGRRHPRYATPHYGRIIDDEWYSVDYDFTKGAVDQRCGWMGAPQRTSTDHGGKKPRRRGMLHLHGRYVLRPGSLVPDTVASRRYDVRGRTVWSGRSSHVSRLCKTPRHELAQP